MTETETAPRDFVGYEYKELAVERGRVSFYVDSYRNFGWQEDRNLPQPEHGRQVTVALKRDRHIMNKAELTRLQRNFEACVRDIDALERSTGSKATALALTVGLLGTAFMACSVFAVTATPPHVAASVACAVPAFLGWIAAPLLYRWKAGREQRRVAALVEEQYEEIYRLCERGHQLLPQSR